MTAHDPIRLRAVLLPESDFAPLISRLEGEASEQLTDVRKRLEDAVRAWEKRHD